MMLIGTLQVLSSAFLVNTNFGGNRRKRIELIVSFLKAMREKMLLLFVGSNSPFAHFLPGLEAKHRNVSSVFLPYINDAQPAAASFSFIPNTHRLMKRLLPKPRFLTSAFVILNLLFAASVFGQQTQKFTITGNFTPPAGVTSITVHAQGAGGGGGYSKGSGGGGGAYKTGTISVTPGVPITVTVGTGGSGGTSVTNKGGDGTASSIGSVIANFGTGGNTAQGTAGTGGAGDKSGGNGTVGTTSGGGVGGGGAGSTNSAILQTGGSGTYLGGDGGNGDSLVLQLGAAAVAAIVEVTVMVEMVLVERSILPGVQVIHLLQLRSCLFTIVFRKWGCNNIIITNTQ